MFAQSTRYINISTVKTRSLAMGGAFTAVKDDMASMDFNPASFSTTVTRDRTQLMVFFNGLGPFVIIKNHSNFSGFDVPLGWMVRGVAFSFGMFNLGILLGEESLRSVERLEKKQFFDASGYEWLRNTSIGFSLALAPQVSIGIAGEFFIRNENNEKSVTLGYRYGILLKTKHNLNIGLCFVDFPGQFKSDRMSLERLADETLNVGISYKPMNNLRVSFDIRNVSDEGKGAVREPHLGFEIIPMRHIALRGGYYKELERPKDAISVGLGIFDWNFILPEHRRFSHQTFGLNTAFIWDRDNGNITRWFILSCVVRI